jgi:hypothetical protein
VCVRAVVVHHCNIKGMKLGDAPDRLSGTNPFESRIMRLAPARQTLLFLTDPSLSSFSTLVSVIWDACHITAWLPPRLECSVKPQTTGQSRNQDSCRLACACAGHNSDVRAVGVGVLVLPAIPAFGQAGPLQYHPVMAHAYFHVHWGS